MASPRTPWPRRHRDRRADGGLAYPPCSDSDRGRHSGRLPLGGELSGIWAARRGTYRVLYRINDSLHEVLVLHIEHRRDAYRPM
ncbi:MAG: type II toxin-antitoxin system RelE/ParE family toxin [Geodermatophilaceae bacterium]